AIGPDSRLILLGDRYQLASVESGSVLADICADAGNNRFSVAQQQAAGALLTGSGQAGGPATSPLADHVVTLRTSRRFNADSAIGQLAAAVNAGDSQAAQGLLRAGHTDLVHHDAAHDAAINRLMDTMAGHYARLLATDDPEQALHLLQRQ